MQSKRLLEKIFPFLIWGPSVTRSTLKDDLLAGITGAVIVLPQGVAFAMIAGMPPEYGLYTAMITPVIAALFGSSYHLISGPTTAISIVVLSTLKGYANPDTETAEFIRLALTLTFLTGLFQFAFGLARMGTLVNFVSHTVIVAFTAGAALLIATSQMKHVFGFEVHRELSFFEKWQTIFADIGLTNFYALGIAMLTLFSAVLINKYRPKLPYMLIAIVLGSLVNYLISGSSHGVIMVNEISSSLPPLSRPDFSLDTLSMLAPGAFAVALLGLIEAVAIARAIATKTGQKIDGNQEFIGQGLSNLVGSFFSSYAGSGSFTRSGINHQVGAKTPVSAIFAAGILAIILLLVRDYIVYLPMPAMGGIILFVAYKLIDFEHIREIVLASKLETGVLLVTFLATLFLELEFAIYIGVFLSLVFFLQKTSKPKIVSLAPSPENKENKFIAIEEQKVDATECPQLKILRIDGSMFFGSVNHISSVLSDLIKGEETHLLIVANGINLVDMSGAELLASEADKWKAKGGGLFISGLKDQARELLRKGHYMEHIGNDHFFEHKKEAISAIYPQLRQSYCLNECKARIFTECPPPPTP